VSTVEVISFGYGYGEHPPAHVTADVRAHFRDPHVDPALRNLTGADEAVRHAVLSTPGIRTLVTGIVNVARGYLRAPVSLPVTIAIGCVGGRHRSVVIASEVARRLGPEATVTHRDIDRPVIERTPSGWREPQRKEKLP